jgi:hypothetical protein
MLGLASPQVIALGSGAVSSSVDEPFLKLVQAETEELVSRLFEIRVLVSEPTGQVAALRDGADDDELTSGPACEAPAPNRVNLRISPRF